MKKLKSEDRGRKRFGPSEFLTRCHRQSKKFFDPFRNFGHDFITTPRLSGIFAHQAKGLLEILIKGP